MAYRNLAFEQLMERMPPRFSKEKWIDPNKELPTYNGYVIAYVENKYGTDIPKIVWCSVYFADFSKCFSKNYTVVGWMPLPPPPNFDKEQIK